MKVFKTAKKKEQPILVDDMLGSDLNECDGVGPVH